MSFLNQQISKDNENKKYIPEIQKRIRFTNAVRGRILMFLVVALELILILGFDINNLLSNGWSGNYAGIYFILHIFIMSASIFGGVLSILYIKNPTHKFFDSISFEIITAITVFLFLVGITFVNGVDQTFSSSISMFLFFILLISVYSLLSPRTFILIITLVYIVFITTMIIFQQNSAVLISNIVNGTLTVITSMIVSLMTYSYAFNYNLKTIKLEEATVKLQQLSITDPLTGISNRRKFENSLQSELARASRHGNSFSLLMIDIDYFKNINDEYGHLEGDRILKDIATVIGKITRTEDTASRYGGEEFIVILTNTDQKGATSKAKQICKEIHNHDFSTTEKITVSVGVTTYKEKDTINSIMKRVDNALYAAKDNGRNRVETI